MESWSANNSTQDLFEMYAGKICIALEDEEKLKELTNDV